MDEKILEELADKILSKVKSDIDEYVKSGKCDKIISNIFEKVTNKITNPNEKILEELADKIWSEVEKDCEDGLLYEALAFRCMVDCYINNRIFVTPVDIDNAYRALEYKTMNVRFANHLEYERALRDKYEALLYSVYQWLEKAKEEL